MRAVAGAAPAAGARRGRWIWGASGALTVTALAVIFGLVVSRAGAHSYYQDSMTTVNRAFSVPQPVTSLAVSSYGMPVRVIARPAIRRAEVTEAVTFNLAAGGGPPAVTYALSRGHLTLTAPDCRDTSCQVAFTVLVPSSVPVTVTSGGGDVIVSGTAGATVDTEGGQVFAAGVHGPLSAITGGGFLVVDGLTGPLYADLAGGTMQARGVSAVTATVDTGGGAAAIGFASAPGTVQVTTEGGAAALGVPAGPYALTADSNDGPEVVRIATDPAAHRSITVNSAGGPLSVGPPSPRLFALTLGTPDPGEFPMVPAAAPAAPAAPPAPAAP